MATKTVKLTIVVQVHDEKALEGHAMEVAESKTPDELDEVIGSYDDHTAGLVVEALVNCDPAPVDYGIEIQSIKAEAVEYLCPHCGRLYEDGFMVCHSSDCPGQDKAKGS